MALVCWNCGESLNDVSLPISRHAACPQCFNELHCCRLCRHFRTDQNSRCNEDRAEPPLVKENANFCDWFAPRHNAFAATQTDSGTRAKSALDALFSVEPENAVASASAEAPDTLTAEEKARAELEKLFKS